MRPGFWDIRTWTFWILAIRTSPIISAARRYNTIYFYEPISPSGRSCVGFRPQMYVDITDVIDTKIAALDEHVTEKNNMAITGSVA